MIPITKAQIQNVIDYDLEVQCGLIRSKYIKNFVLQSNATSLVRVVDCSRKSKSVIGNWYVVELPHTINDLHFLSGSI